jgi:hypothetical protein
MVWRRMGLLDDAIREHLELKRRRGADPGEVAREQREALDPVPRDEVEEAEEDVPVADKDMAGNAPVGAPGVAPVAAVLVEDHVDQAPQVEGTAARDVGETAELDMRTVLDEDEQARPLEDAPRPAPASEESARRAADAVPLEEDSLEWEITGEVAEQQPDAEDPAEDVLEETPDFLRDTPEQERLWFEQRPPRDFDFDK